MAIVTDTNAADTSAGEDKATDSVEEVVQTGSDKALDSSDAAAADAAQDTTTDNTEAESKVEELDDDTIELLAEVYKDRLLSSKSLQADVEQTVSRQVRSRTAEITRTRTGEQRVGDALAAGQSAATALGQMTQKFSVELGKAARQIGDNTDKQFSQIPVSEQDYRQAVSQLASSVGQIYEARIDEATDAAIALFDGDGFPKMGDSHVDELSRITNTFDRMRADPNQSSRATSYLLTALVGFAADRGRDAGVLSEQTRSTGKKTLQERIAGNNAVKAATAKAAAGKSPPVTPKSEPGDASGMPTLEAYRQAKKDGDVDKINEIAAAMANRATTVTI